MKKLLYLLLLFFMQVTSAEERAERIIGGRDINISQVPWQAYIEISFSLCGGVVIGDRWVLTAAHCVNVSKENGQFELASLNSVRVYTGITNTNEVSSTTASLVRQIYVNPNYNSITFANDIALIELSTPVRANARAIALPSSSELANFEATAGQNSGDVLISGWGVTNINRNPDFPDVLQGTWVSLVTNERCSAQWGTTLTGVPNYQDVYVCTTSNNHGACNGDSGGPVVWFDGNLAAESDRGARLVGLVSFGPESGCGDNNFSDVNTRVPFFASWIQECQTGQCNTLPSSATASMASSSGSGGGISWMYALLSFMLLRFFVCRNANDK